MTCCCSPGRVPFRGHGRTRRQLETAASLAHWYHDAPVCSMFRHLLSAQVASVMPSNVVAHRSLANVNAA